MNAREVNYKRLVKKYDEKRAKAHRELLARKAEVYQKVPEIEHIDRELNRCGISLVKRIMTNAALLEAYRERTTELAQDKMRLLTLNGYPKNYLEEQFECPACQDTGYLKDGTRCKCFEQGLIDIAYEQSNIKAILEKENFDAFSFEYYSDVPPHKNMPSPLERMKKINQVCVELLAHFDTEKENLFLTGQTGLGKTFMCNCIAKALLDSGYTVLYFTAPQLFQYFDDIRFHNKKTQDKLFKEERLAALYEVDMLVIDDLGSELITDPRQSDLFNIINTRYLNQKSTIISTNLTFTQLTELYSDRITSRIIGQYIRLQFIGEDIRKQKKYRER